MEQGTIKSGAKTDKEKLPCIDLKTATSWKDVEGTGSRRYVEDRFDKITDDPPAASLLMHVLDTRGGADLRR